MSMLQMASIALAIPASTSSKPPSDLIEQMSNNVVDELENQIGAKVPMVQHMPKSFIERVRSFFTKKITKEATTGLADLTKDSSNHNSHELHKPTKNIDKILRPFAKTYLGGGHSPMDLLKKMWEVFELTKKSDHNHVDAQ